MSSRPLALVTGASGGLGETFARQLAHRGYDLILVARRHDRLQALARSLPTHAEPLPADLTSELGLETVEKSIAASPRLELLVNNAGFGTLGRFWEAGIAGQDAMHRLHVLATMRLCHAALPGMVERAKGAIVNVSSVAAFANSPGNAGYCSTKAWMNSFTEGLDIDLRTLKSPVRVQALCPGFTVTEFHETLGVERDKIPAWLWMTADTVVETSLRALGTRKVVVIPGWQYKLAAAFMRHMPYSIRRRAGRPGKDKRV